MPIKNYGPRTTPRRRHYCPHFQVAVREPTPLERLDIQCPEDTVGADCGTKNHLVVSSGHRAQHQGGEHRRNKKRKHQRHIAGKPHNSKRRRHAVAEGGKRSRRYAQLGSQSRSGDVVKQSADALTLGLLPVSVQVGTLHCGPEVIPLIGTPTGALPLTSTLAEVLNPMEATVSNGKVQKRNSSSRRSVSALVQQDLE